MDIAGKIIRQGFQPDLYSLMDTTITMIHRTPRRSLLIAAVILTGLLLTGLAYLYFSQPVWLPVLGRDLDNTAWVLVQMEGNAPLPGSQITMTFNNGQVRGSAGCNLYSARYAANGQWIKFDSLSNTARACAGDHGADFMDQEQRYLTILRNAVQPRAAYRRTPNRLETLNIDSSPGLVFSPATGQPSNDLVETPGSRPTYLVSSLSQTQSSYPAPIPQINLATAYPFDERQVKPTQDQIQTASPSSPPVPPTLTFTTTPTPDAGVKAAALLAEWNACQQNQLLNPPIFPADPSLAGLVFRVENVTWQIDRQGNPALLGCQADFWTSLHGDRLVFKHLNGLWMADKKTGRVLPVSPLDGNDYRFLFWSPTGKQVFFFDAANNSIESPNKNIWVYDTQRGVTRKLTDSPKIIKQSAWLWSDQEDILLYIGYPPNDPPGPGTGGTLFQVNVNDNVEVQISKEDIGETLAFSPDGKSLSFMENGTILLMQRGKKIQSLSTSEYTIPGWVARGIIHLNWSPDGHRLAGLGGARNETGDFSGILVLNLTNSTGMFLHPFVHVGMGGSPTYPGWSPDGKWLTFYIADADFSKLGFYIARADGSQEHFLGIQSQVVAWSPDSQRLIVFKENAEAKYWIVTTADWSETPLKIPIDQISGWKKPEK